LLKNQVGKLNHWLGVKLVAKRANPDAIGAVITWQSGELRRSHFKTGAGSYLASHDPRMVLGIGKQPRIDWVEVKWPMPSGRTERFTGLPPDQYTTLVEGQGEAVR